MDARIRKAASQDRYQDLSDLERSRNEDLFSRRLVLAAWQRNLAPFSTLVYPFSVRFPFQTSCRRNFLSQRLAVARCLN